MPYFDRFDVCEAYAALETDYNVSGALQERPHTQIHGESVGAQLHRIGFRLWATFKGYESLTENGKAIYDCVVDRLGLAHTQDRRIQ